MRLSNVDRSNQKRKLAEEISKELGGSPLYTSQAQGSMALSWASLAEYLQMIRSRSNILDVKSTNSWRYGRAESAMHDRILKELSEEAEDLLFMLAPMSTEDISEDLLLFEHQHKDLKLLSDKPG